MNTPYGSRPNKLFGALWLILFLAPSLQAGVLYDNLGPTNDFSHSGGYLIGVFDNANWRQGFQFTASSSGYVSSLDVAISYNEVLNETVTYQLYNDNLGTVGTLLEEFAVVASMPWLAQTGIESVLGLGTTFLSAGSDYWLMATAPSWTVWSFNDTGDLLRRAYNPGGPAGLTYDDGSIAAAFRLNSVPEPATLALITFGFAGIGYRRREQIKVA